MTPGYKTKTFWATACATVLAALTASGMVGDGSMVAQVLATGGAALAAAGYASLRAFAKGKDGKASWRTTEFWLACAACVVGLAGASGALPVTGPVAQLVGAAAAVLTGLGYTARHALPPVAPSAEG